MKTTINILVSGLLFVIGDASAQNTLTVDNNPGAVAMFDNFADAYEAAEPGDTILLAGSPNDYGVHTIHKRLKIEGPGYFLVENDIPGINKRSASIGLIFENSLQFGNPSNSKISGIMLSGFSSRVDADCSGILFDKVFFATQGGDLFFSSPVVILRSFQTGGFSLRFYEGSGGSAIANSNLGRVQGVAALSIDRCILRRDGLFNPQVSITNSIFTEVNPSSGSPSISHCIAIYDILPSGSGNMNNQLLTGPGGVFETFNNNNDIAVLRSDSPAKGAGTGGSDIGIEGGVTPYIAGGVPTRPRLTLLSAPNSATNASGLTFQVGAQAFGD